MKLVLCHEIRMLSDGDETMFWGTVERYEPPLLKLADHVTPKGDPFFPPGTVPGQIINVTSPNFISAVLNEKK